MLVRTLFMLAMIAAVSIAMVHATASLARAAIHRHANLAAETAFTSAIVSFESSVATVIAAGTDPRALPALAPSPTPTCMSKNSAGTCEFTATTTITSTVTQQVGTAAESSGTCTPLCATNLQENDAVAEGRIAAHITIAITGGANASDSLPLATRDRYAIFRTMRIPPYVMLAGTRDATSARIATGSQEGEDAGIPSLTAINVVYKNAGTGTTTSGNAWQSRAWSDADTSVTNWDP